MLLTRQHLDFLNLEGGCTGSSESTLVKMPHCRGSNTQCSCYRGVNRKRYKESTDAGIARNSVFDCHLSPVGRQIAIENSVSNFL